ncbi:hypothetical protein G8E10_09485 [Rhizobiaceae bacterium CRRU44]|uniref:Uncharacterized protein n=1 Tax=Ferranicluibacter rubi TaxID=2715133 RepID=A0AA43ZF47_9HYPH|nr:hypothetical protein [Ferranicluibacter rubi]NHT75911.1 hypothetical protein [Ferranicluibacter rubi]NHT75971.1 hypothetical protein [Ferranicluibacter rubi]
MLERVTAHAVLRYLERVLHEPVQQWLADQPPMRECQKLALCCERAGLPADAVRLSMLTQPVINALNTKRSQKTTLVTENAVYVIDGRKIITVLAIGMRPKKKQKFKAHKSRQLAEV